MVKHIRSDISLCVLSLTVVGALVASACSSGGSGTGEPGDGATGSGEETSSGGSSGGPSSSSSGSSSGTGGTSTGGTTGDAGPGNEGGADSSVIGADSSAIGPDSSAVGPDSSAIGPDSSAMGADSSTMGEGGEGGSAHCAGNALSLTANGSGTGTTGANNDAAAARVDVNFGTTCAGLPIGNSFRTVEFWAYVLTDSWVGNTNTIYFYGSTARPAHGFGLDFGTDAVNGNHATLDPFTNGGYDDDDQPSGLTTSMNQWIHLAMTWDGTAVRTFVNGVETITTMGTGTSVLNTDCSKVTVGGYEEDSNYFNGYIDEFRIWNVAHTAAQITSTMHSTLTGTEAGLVNYLKFDESSGATAYDSVTTAGHTAANGTLNSANGHPPTFIPSTAPITTCP